MKIGNVSFAGNIFLAPLAGVSDLAFRHVAGEYGADLTYTEMVSCKAIVYNNKNTKSLLDTSLDIAPVAVQLFGSDPKFIYESIKMIDDMNFSIIDFNMGCPVPKVVRNGEGSALLNNPKLIYDIISTARKATNKPITAKIRKGFDKVNAVEVSKVIEEAGGSCVAIHGRTRGQYYSGEADWDIIAEVKSRVNIPVIGNGDITSPEKCKQIFEYTGCDAVMIGRAAQGNPFIFKQIKQYMEKGKYDVVEIKELLDVMKKHADLLIKTKGEKTGYSELRKHIAWYTHGMRNASSIRRECMRINNYSDFLNVIDHIMIDSRKNS